MRAWPGAACQDEDPELFFPATYRPPDVAAAREVCARCPITDECLRYALGDPDLEGVWAGTTWPQRHRLRKQELDEWDE